MKTLKLNLLVSVSMELDGISELTPNELEEVKEIAKVRVQYVFEADPNFKAKDFAIDQSKTSNGVMIKLGLGAEALFRGFNDELSDEELKELHETVEDAIVESCGIKKQNVIVSITQELM